VIMLSVLISTRNEEQDLPECIAALDWCDDLVVYDSYSSDLTESIAIDAGARLVRRPGQDLSIAFGGDEGFHRTWALREISFAHPWLLVLDADERLSPEAVVEISDILSDSDITHSKHLSSAPVAYQLRRRDFFQGRYLKHVQVTPWYVRLFRPEFVHYERLVNPVVVVNGPVRSLHGFIDHFPFSKGMTHWIARHNTYSTLEAKQQISTFNHSLHSTIYCAFLSDSFSRRRYYQKQFFNRLPGRPLIKFIWLYFLKRGFLDLRPGFTYALLQSIYEYFILLKIQELRQSLLVSDVQPLPSSSADCAIRSNSVSTEFTQ